MKERISKGKTNFAWIAFCDTNGTECHVQAIEWPSGDGLDITVGASRIELSWEEWEATVKCVRKMTGVGGFI